MHKSLCKYRSILGPFGGDCGLEPGVPNRQLLEQRFQPQLAHSTPPQSRAPSSLVPRPWSFVLWSCHPQWPQHSGSVIDRKK